VAPNVGDCDGAGDCCDCAPVSSTSVADVDPKCREEEEEERGDLDPLAAGEEGSISFTSPADSPAA